LDIELTVRSGNIPDAAKDYAREKLTKAARIFDRIGSLHIQLEEGTERSKVHLVAHLDTGATLVAEEESPELRSAIDLCSDKFDRQVRRAKERLIDRNRKAPDSTTPVSPPLEIEPSYDEVIREELDQD
jgi:ribosome hibernation promoting factor